jgi:hypothetical protein
MDNEYEETTKEVIGEGDLAGFTEVEEEEIPEVDDTILPDDDDGAMGEKDDEEAKEFADYLFGEEDGFNAR